MNTKLFATKDMKDTKGLDRINGIIQNFGFVFEGNILPCD